MNKVGQALIKKIQEVEVSDILFNNIGIVKRILII